MEINKGDQVRSTAHSTLFDGMWFFPRGKILNSDTLPSGTKVYSVEFPDEVKVVYEHTIFEVWNNFLSLITKEK